ncbi:MAG: TetR/AcrR family transcriptional regulator [Nitratireductor sp.]
MAKRKTGDKLGDIRRATIAEVVECGSSAASVNTIAKRAGLAVGTVYRYYENKDHLLRAAYVAIKEELHNAMVEAASQVVGSRSRVRALWFAVLEYAHQHPQSFLFAEVVVNDMILTDQEKAVVTEMARQTRAFIEEAIADGTVRDLDTQAIVTVLAAPALHLGRSAAMSGKTPDRAHAEEIFELCWRAIEA